MTAQMPDLFRHEGVDYDLAGISAGGLFNPSQFGLKPEGTCTACWRGYQAVFALAGSRLVLVTQGSSARMTEGTAKAPVDCVIIGIIDSIAALGETVYHKAGG